MTTKRHLFFKFFFANISLDNSRIFTLSMHAVMRRAPWSTMPCRPRGQLAGGGDLGPYRRFKSTATPQCRAAVASSAAKIATYCLASYQ
jgi:hypothetical protein